MKPVNNILLVSMPWASSRRPLLGLGVLCGKLKRLHYHVNTYYPNVRFAQTFGYEQYEFFADSPGLYPFAEYLFAAIYFDYSETRVNESVESLLGQQLLRDNPQLVDSVSTLIQEVIPDFLETTLDEILAVKPQVVGFSSTFNQIFPSLLMCRRIKERAPQIVTLLGGSSFHGEMGIEYSRAFWDVADYVFTGEADNSLPAFLEHLNGERSYAEVDGIASKGVCLKDTVPVANMGDVSAPDYDEYFSELQVVFAQKAPIVNEGIPFESSRGCWWGQKNHCTFCGLNNLGMDYRFKNDEAILAELASLSQKYKSLNFISADNILRSNAYGSLLLKLSRQTIRYNLFYEVKANLRRKDVYALHTSGVSWIQPGIESFSTHILKCMKKGVSALQNVQLLRLVTEHQIQVSYNLLTGFLGETAENYQEMILLIRKILHLQPPSGPSTQVQVHRFSPMHNSPEQNGLEQLRPCAYYQTWFPQNFMDIPKAAYFFEGDHTFEPCDTRELNLHIQQWVASKERVFAEPGTDFIVITKQSGEKTEKQVLNAVESLIFLLTDEVTSRFSMVKHFEKILPAEQIDEKLAQMEARGLLLSEAEKWVNVIPFNRVIKTDEILGWIETITQSLVDKKPAMVLV